MIEEQSILCSRLPKIFLTIMSMGLRKQEILKAAKNVDSGFITMASVCEVIKKLRLVELSIWKFRVTVNSRLGRIFRFN